MLVLEAQLVGKQQILHNACQYLVIFNKLALLLYLDSSSATLD